MLKEKIILIISHNDLDGNGSTIIGKRLFKNVKCKNINNSEVESCIENLIDSKEYEKYDYIFICDLNFSEKLAKKIDSNESLRNKIKLFDHHENAICLNKYDWAIVNHKYENSKSGTQLFYEYLTEVMNEYIGYLNDFAELVKIYDIWEWKLKYNGTGKGLKAKRLNDLFNFLGPVSFEKQLNKYDFKIDQVIDESYKIFEDVIEYQKNKYIKNHKDKMIKINLTDNIKIGMLIADQYISELGNILCEENDIDAVFLLGPDRISLRSIGDKFNCSKLASIFNGGGHLNAAGFTIKEEQLRSIFNNIICKLFYQNEIEQARQVLKFLIDKNE